MTQEALKLALEALENGDVPTPENAGKNLDAITAIKEALAQKQEPIAMLFGSLPVYDRTTPPQRTEQLKACVYCGQLVAKEKNT